MLCAIDWRAQPRASETVSSTPIQIQNRSKDKSDGCIHEDAVAVVAETEATAPRGVGGVVSENTREVSFFHNSYNVP